ncbi:hypothetical protein DMNBHIDG_01099 [Candidatus Methanoperedenaceae archaeon GB37]|nr:hypothetical protein DMNBHIDG_01099 [Candidatus Methanoperedenaceae archaeon GB37]
MKTSYKKPEKAYKPAPGVTDSPYSPKIPPSPLYLSHLFPQSPPAFPSISLLSIHFLPHISLYSHKVPFTSIQGIIWLFTLQFNLFYLHRKKEEENHGSTCCRHRLLAFTKVVSASRVRVYPSVVIPKLHTHIAVDIDTGESPDIVSYGNTEYLYGSKAMRFGKKSQFPPRHRCFTQSNTYAVLLLSALSLVHNRDSLFCHRTACFGILKTKVLKLPTKNGC